MAPVRFDITCTGRVQGVFFRATTEGLARGFAVSGWVRNQPDGSVRCVAEGDESELHRFVAAVQDAKGANIEGIHLTSTDATGEFTGFSIRH